MLNDDFPLRVEAVPAAHTTEWRADDSFLPSETEAWQLIFVRSGTIEERCDDRHVLLRAGGLLFHQPGEVFAMTTVGEVPPETLRIDFYCTGAAMDRFRGAMLHAEPAEQHDLNWLANAANELFDAAPVPGGRPVVKEELPFGAMQQFIIHLENLLILLARRACPPRRPVAASGGSAAQNAHGGGCPRLFCRKPGTGVESGRSLRGPGLHPAPAAAGLPRPAAPHGHGGIFRHAHRVCGPAAGTRGIPRRGRGPDGLLLGRVFQPEISRSHRPHTVGLPAHPAGTAR